MLDGIREVVGVESYNVSCSLPASPVTKNTKISSVQQTVSRVENPVWQTGVPTPINNGVLTPNQKALALLTGFATGSIRMKDDAVQHLPIVQGNKSIGESLQELPWYSPNPAKKIDGSANRSEKTKLINSGLKKTLVSSTIAGQLADQYPRKPIPDSEIKPENIISGSPEYIPYKRLKY